MERPVHRRESWMTWMLMKKTRSLFFCLRASLAHVVETFSSMSQHAGPDFSRGALEIEKTLPLQMFVALFLMLCASLTTVHLQPHVPTAPLTHASFKLVVTPPLFSFSSCHGAILHSLHNRFVRGMAMLGMEEAQLGWASLQPV